MRKLKLQMQMTLDGFVAGPNGELDWMSMEMDPQQYQQLQQLTETMDTILMGRKMANGFTSYWEKVVDTQPASPEYPYAKIFVDTPKIVFTKTNQVATGRNVVMENGDLVSAVQALKQQPGKDLIVYGGASFVSALLSFQLIEELHLFVNPTAIGSGLRIFHDRLQFRLLDSTACANGMLINRYAPLAMKGL